MNLMEAFVKIGLDDSAVDSGIAGLRGKLSSGLGAAAKVGAAALTAATGAVVGFTKSAVDVGSQFDASMSNVAAISGATAEEFDQLRAKAREMGANTQYSASEAADAMSYMAMAGWKTNDMLEGISGIMNLAAAGGADLAEASDIVTDALTAFGQGADQAGRLADIMAAASSNSNTNVHLLGETFKYVAPLAGSLGYEMEDTAVAIGLMANAGIKGSQGGTALRSILTRLAKPTKESSTAMAALGISLEDGEGNMLTLMEVMEQMRTAFHDKLMIPEEEFQASLAELNQKLEDGEITQKEYDKSLEALTDRAYGAEGAMMAQYAAMLGGQEALSGLLAIVNASEEDFSKLSSAISNSSGAMSFDVDKVKGQLKEITDKYTETINGIESGVDYGAMLDWIREDLEAGGKGFSEIAKEISETFQISMDDAIASVRAVSQELSSVDAGFDVSAVGSKLEEITKKYDEVWEDGIHGIDWDAMMWEIKAALESGAQTSEEVAKKIADDWGMSMEDAAESVRLVDEAMQSTKGAAEEMAGKMQDNLAGDMKNLKSAIREAQISLADQLMPTLRMFAQTARESVGTATTKLNEFFASDAMQKKMQAITDAVARVVDALVNNLDPILSAVIGLIDGAATGIAFLAENLDMIIEGIKLMTAAFVGLKALELVTSIGGIVTTFSALASSAGGVGAAIGAIANPIGLVVAGVAAAAVLIITHWDQVKEFFLGAWEAVKGAWGAATDFFGGIWENIKSGTAPLRETISNAFSSAWEGVKSAWSDPVSFFTNVINNIIGVFKSVPQIIRTVGANIMDGLGAGLMDRLQNVVDKARNVASNILGAVKGFFGIASPSKVMRAEVGQQIGAGIQLGMEDSMPAIDGAVDAIGNSITGIDAGVSSAGGNTGRIEQLLITMIEIMQRMGVTIDGKALVGYIAPDIDNYLGAMVNNLQREAVYV